MLDLNKSITFFYNERQNHTINTHEHTAYQSFSYRYINHYIRLRIFLKDWYWPVESIVLNKGDCEIIFTQNQENYKYNCLIINDLFNTTPEQYFQMSLIENNFGLEYNSVLLLRECFSGVIIPDK